MAMNLMDNLNFLKKEFLEITSISQVIISKPDMNDHWYNKSNFPKIHMWDSGSDPIGEDVSSMSRRQNWKINICVFVRNNQSQEGEYLYKELRRIESKINKYIYDLSAKSYSGNFCLVNQWAGSQTIIYPDDKTRLLFRSSTYKVQIVESLE